MKIRAIFFSRTTRSGWARTADPSLLSTPAFRLQPNWTFGAVRFFDSRRRGSPPSNAVRSHEPSSRGRTCRPEARWRPLAAVARGGYVPAERGAARARDHRHVLKYNPLSRRGMLSPRGNCRACLSIPRDGVRPQARPGVTACCPPAARLLSSGVSDYWHKYVGLARGDRIDSSAVGAGEDLFDHSGLRPKTWCVRRGCLMDYEPYPAGRRRPAPCSQFTISVQLRSGR